MKIHGLQKMTLLDFPGHVACTVFLGGCSFRCPFCHNFELADGTTEPVMDEEELTGFLRKRTGLLDGVAFTGGEPCLHKDLPLLMRRVKGMGYAVKLDTNGNHPELLGEILDDGLADYVAMDIKNSPVKYARTCGLESLDLSPVMKSIGLIMEGRADYEFRTTVVKELHEGEDFREIGRMIAGARRYFLQSFTDRDTVPYAGFHAPSPEELREYSEIIRPFVQDVTLRGVD